MPLTDSVRRYLSGLTVCIDCSAERPYGAKNCPSCDRCCSCGYMGCNRVVCWEDQDRERVAYGADSASHVSVASMLLAGGSAVR